MSHAKRNKLNEYHKKWYNKLDGDSKNKMKKTHMIDII